jgi:hypothetical protein
MEGGGMAERGDPRLLKMWATWGALALAFSLSHVLIDFQVGLFGPSSEQMQAGQALLILLVSLLYAWWGVSFAWAGLPGARAAGLAGLLVPAFLWSFVANGLVGVAACPPPCSGAWPYQDIAHFGNVIFGGLASAATWRAVRLNSGPARWPAALTGVGLTVAILALQGVLFAAR